MPQTIRLAEGLDLPDDAATQVYAFMGRRGSGKTYGAGVLVEQILGHGDQVVILDPVGVWWGLRLAADGKRPGLKIPVFGGSHGDIPLQATAGKVVAELVAERGTSLVLDVSEFTKSDQRRFVADFAAELFHAKKRHRSAVLVVFEEAQEFAPQHVRGDVAKMVGAIETLVKLGRNYGVGAMLISQRPQAVNKEVLNLSEVMLAFQLTGPQERKTIAGWVQEKGAEGRGDISGELPSLPVGTAMIWSPQWLGHFGRHKLLRKETFDASATPTFGKAQAAATLAPIDLDAVKDAMAATIEHAKASNPAALREEISRLNHQVMRLTNEVERGRAVSPPAPVEVERVPESLLAGIRAAEARTHDISKAAAELGAMVERNCIQAMELLEDAERQSKERPPAPGAARGTIVTPVAGTSLQRRVERSAAAAPSGDLPSGARNMLHAVATRGSLTRAQLATLSSIAPTGGTFAKYLSILKTTGLVEVDGHEVKITDAGRGAAGPVCPPINAGAVLSMWREKMPGKARDMLELFAAEHGPFTKDQSSKRLDLDSAGGTFAKYLSILRTNGLVHKTRGGFVVSQEIAL